MKITIYYSLFISILAFSVVAAAQPSYIYEGGDGGGYSMQSNFSGDSYPFEGSAGGGYASAVWMKINLVYYIGGANDGYSSTLNNNGTNYLFEGGSGEGYTMIEKCEDFIWTGAIGVGWGVTGNWNYNIVPDLKRMAIIPASVPSYPHVNAGIFAIGDNPNNGAFECGELWVQDGALLVTRINNFVENYGTIVIDGTMQVKNSAPDAFQNLSGGLVRISPTGLFLIMP